MDSTAKELGLGENIAVKLNRGSRISGCQERYTIGTDKQLELEISSILSGVDKLLSTSTFILQSTLRLKDKVFTFPYIIMIL